MITNPVALALIRTQWSVVLRFCEASHAQYMSPSGCYINETPPESFFNLPLILAFGVLDQVLDEFIRQKIVPRPAGRSTQLAAKMDAAKSAITWQNFSHIELGREERNKVAHDGNLLGRATCIIYVKAIEAELSAWHIL